MTDVDAARINGTPYNYDLPGVQLGPNTSGETRDPNRIQTADGTHVYEKTELEGGVAMYPFAAPGARAGAFLLETPDAGIRALLLQTFQKNPRLHAEPEDDIGVVVVQSPGQYTIDNCDLYSAVMGVATRALREHQGHIAAGSAVEAAGIPADMEVTQGNQPTR